MNKSDLVKKFSERFDIFPSRAAEIVNAVIAELSDALISDRRIEIRGFGSFVTKFYKSRCGRNPKTGDSVLIPSKRTPSFRVGRDLYHRLNNKGVEGS